MKQIIKFTAAAAATMLLVAVLIAAANYILVDDADSYTRLTMHEFYETEENIDTLFLGSSHCFRAYDPSVYDELTRKNSYNLGSSSQNYDTSYYLLREAARYNDIETVYLDMHYKFLFIGKEDRDLVQANIITDYMKLSLNKLEFLMTTSSLSELTNRILPFRRSLTSIGDAAYIASVIESKSTDGYREYQSVEKDQEYYAGKGFVYSDAVFDADAVTWWENFSKVSEDMDSDETYTLEYIGRIVSFCEKNDIRLVFVTAPSYDGYLEAVGPYDEAHDYIQALADSYGVEYMDFNLIKDEYYDPGEDYFIDVDHLNGEGAAALTKLLAEIEEGLDSGAQLDEYFNKCYDTN